MCSYRKGSGPWQIVVFVTSFVRIFLGGEEDEDKRMVKLFFLFFFLKTSFFGHILKTKIAQSVFGAWSFLLVHICFTPNKGPKGFVN